MWYIVAKTESDIKVLLLTKSKDECIKEYKKLEKEAEKQAKELDESKSVFYYYGIINKTSYGKSLSNIKKECFNYGLDIKEELLEDFKNLQECISLARYNLTEDEVNLLLRFLYDSNLCECGCPDPFFCPTDCKDCLLTKRINKLKNKLISLGGKLNEINKLVKNNISKENL